MPDISSRPIGVVRSAITAKDEMPRGGVPAAIEVFPEFEDGLEGIEDNSHVVVVAWLHEARRDTLKVQRPGGRANGPRGVFATRSPNRPNPLGIMVARLTRREGRVLSVDRLDMVDGTPVIDIKPYAHGFDGAFSARNVHELSQNDNRDRDTQLRDMVHEAENFHGESCAGVRLGARLMYHAMTAFNIAQKDAGLIVTPGADGCIADALQALSGATLGNRRLKCRIGEDAILEYNGRKLRFTLDRQQPKIDGILAAEEAGLFQVTEEAGDNGD